MKFTKKFDIKKIFLNGSKDDIRVPVEPTARPPNDPEQQALEDRLKHDNQHAVELLQEMYELDLKIWAGQNADDDEDLVEIDAMKRSANSRFVEVRLIVEGWDDIPQNRWTAEQRTIAKSIRDTVLSRAEEKRYPV